jgi:hypothetical protein
LIFNRLNDSELERPEEDRVKGRVELDESAVLGDELLEPILRILLVARTALMASFHRLLGILESPKIKQQPV